MTKIEAARQEYADWCAAVGIHTLDDVNQVLREGRAIPFINLCEARQERKYAEAADCIHQHCGEARIVMMSGPSSSGKTSSSLRIAQQAKVLGLNPKVIELDNFFVNREDTPRDADGNFDFECLGAMDIRLLGDTLNALLAGEEVRMPRFDFTSGRQVFEPGNRLRLHDGDILFMEGIHALNPALTPSVAHRRIFRIYISALSALPGGEKVHNSTTDKRLLRRIVRDSRTRGISAEENILRWPSVRKGETDNIFPYEENADLVFNSSMPYDVPLLKYYAEPLLHEISETSPAYEKAHALLSFLEHVTALKPAEIAAVPPTSIMREFIGGQKL
ncbi:MAG: nucleoside kinase [Bacteroidales bacterium]|nr:nucleoside kinase [Bacteroidales bacterium]